MTAGRRLDSAGAEDRTTCGAKAARLACLQRAGLPVPQGWVVTVDDDPRNAAAAAIAAIGAERWAVRSSAPDEDGRHASMAGTHTTELEVRASGIPAAISRVRRSNAGPIPVLLMPMLTADWGGVAFTADPVDGSPGTLIEAVAGTTTAATAGTTDPWSVRVGIDGDHTDPTHDGPDVAVIDDVVSLARRVADLAGVPQDIEWASVDGEVWLLQARPMTARQLPVPAAPPPRQRWGISRDHRWRPPYPLEHSVWAPRLELSMQRGCAASGAPAETLEQQLIGGWAYHRMVPLGGGRYDDQKPPPAWLMGVAARLLPSIRHRLATAARAAELGDRQGAEWESGERQRLRDRARALRCARLEALGPAELADHLEAVLLQLQAAADVHATLPLTTTHLRLGSFGMWCEERLGWDASATLAAVEAVRTPTPSALAALAHGLDENDLEVLRGDDPLSVLDTESAGASAIRAHLDEHGHQTFGVDLSTPTWAEDPLPLLRLLGHSAPTATSAPSPVAAPAELTPDEQDTYRSLLTRAAETAHYGDETEVDVLQAMALVRITAIAAGRRLVADGTLAAPDDVLFLTTGELNDLLRGRPTPPPVDARRAQHRWAIAHPGPERYGPEPQFAPGLSGLPRRGGQAWGALLWALTAVEGEHPSTSGAGPHLRGVGASPGRARGPVRVVRDATDFAAVTRGDILVCHSTLATWAVLFPVVGGVISEVGGALSHPAILAREHSVPAVAGVTGALDTLVDGDMVTIDGRTGEISREPQHT